MTAAVQSFGLSQRRTCRLTGWNRSSLQYQPQAKNDTTERNRLKELAAAHPRWGCPMLHDVLRAEGVVINHKRTERLYREEQLSLRRKHRKKLPAEKSFDFVSATIGDTIQISRVQAVWIGRHDRRRIQLSRQSRDFITFVGYPAGELPQKCQQTVKPARAGRMKTSHSDLRPGG